MGKFLKFLGAAAVLTAITPYKVTSNKELEETTVQALLWQLTAHPDPEDGQKRRLSLTLGVSLPTKAADDGFDGESAACPKGVSFDFTVHKAEVQETAPCCQSCADCESDAPAPQEPAADACSEADAQPPINDGESGC